MSSRDAILKAADRLFAQNGYGLVGVDTLAAEAGVTKRTLYKQFGSKEGLFVAWLTLRDEQTRGALLRAVERNAGTPKAQLLALFEILAMLAAKAEFNGCPFSHALLEFADAPAQSASRAVAQAHKAALLAWFTERLKAAGNANPVATAEEIAVLYEGVLQRIAATHSPEPARAARRLLEIRLA
jgi:AcrR family transcriptional regulator